MFLPSSAWVPMTMSIVAVREALLDLGEFLAGDEARGLGDLHRQAAEALGEGLEVLAGEQRGRHHDRHLLAGKHGDEGRAQRHLGLAEADIAADQPVHGPPAREIVEHGVDAGDLVLGLLIREARGELVVEAVRRRRSPAPGAARASAATLISFSAMSRMRCLSLALRDCQATPPSRSSCDAGFVGAVAGQELDVLDRQIELVAAVIDAARGNRAARPPPRWSEPDEAADAVIGMDHQIADGRGSTTSASTSLAAASPGRGGPAGRRECPARR